MKNEMMLFNNPEFGTVRTLTEDNGKILFCGSDVATALGYAVPRKALFDHCKGVLKRNTPTAGGPQELSFIPESDVYRLVFSSKLPNAERFTDWVTEEVLPSIRKNGGYIAGQSELTPEELMAKAVLVAQRTIAEKEARISALTVHNAIMAPKADYFDELVERNTLTNFRETAKELGIPPKKFVSFLLEKKYIYRDKKGKLLPKEDKNSGLFEVKECFNEKTQWSGTQALVTPKGRETFRLLYPTV
ncbi:phage antirepressor KilAC domain-containing protein [Oscillibacter sp. MSJ-2]|uniref:Phage antirepressor KilAC domain-containing protein n=1 Tax=Dysosmobacter acutus TaxID=2841504 RepID=A0ABS6F8X5_9FIRM|nr:phage antirepressor KilAC domain-containing protein [Dysosmobacter acutus]MBU5626533.1 phage antirepressor KilAC domain-containing protein [Dysosmobacter acutus]